jgi:PKD domain
MLHRNWIRFISALAIVVLLLAGCTASPTANPPRERPTLAPMPYPVPTSSALPARLYLTLAYDSSAPLHGTPPFTANLVAAFYGDSSLTHTCQTVRWRFGDGSEETQPCVTNGEQPYRFEIKHTYTQPSTYHVTAIITLADGREIESTKTEAVVVAIPQPVSPMEPIIFWGAWIATLLIVVFAFVWLRRRSRRAKIIGYAVIALGLISFVPPFSYLPNPAGLAWAMLGHYAYDPRMPFVNRFVIAGDPTAMLRPWLDGLVGQTGLDPLDPVQLLARYEFVQVRYPARYGVLQVGTRLTYADGSQRTYNIPLYQSNAIFGFYQSDWLYDGLGRLRTEHRELPGTPFADANSPVRLGAPRSLALHPQAQMLDADNPANWGPVGVPFQRLVWSPQGDAFLVMQTINYEQHDLWLVNLDGTPPVRIAQNVQDYEWSLDGKYIVYLRESNDIYPQPVIDQTYPPVRQHLVDIVSVRRTDGSERVVAQTPNRDLPGTTSEGIWYEWQDAVWLAPFEGGTPKQSVSLPDLNPPVPGAPPYVSSKPIRPSPDGARIAYACGENLCLIDRDGTNWARVTSVPDANPLSFGDRAIAWSADGERVALVWGDRNYSDAQTAATRLFIVTRVGTVEREIAIAPEGFPVGVPQWTPEGKRIFVQTYPFGGRRILTVDVTSGEVLDLSQPRWDAWFALAPDGNRLLLANGRGGFWTSAVVETR